jgi:hypothetical protein
MQENLRNVVANIVSSMLNRSADEDTVNCTGSSDLTETVIPSACMTSAYIKYPCTFTRLPVQDERVQSGYECLRLVLTIFIYSNM